MDKQIQKQHKNRAVELGNSGNPNALPELIELAASPAAQVRKLAASAIGKLAQLADAQQAVNTLQPLLRDDFPQVRQYTAKALSAYGKDAIQALSDLRDMAVNPAETQYNQNGAKRATETIEEARQIEERRAEHCCQRCGVKLEHDEETEALSAAGQAADFALSGRQSTHEGKSHAQIEPV